MKLSTLGSNKYVTTVNAILTEVFTGVKPDEITVYRESESLSMERRKNDLLDALRLLGLKPQVKEVTLEPEITKWRDVMSRDESDVFDLTPGRKYMALSAYYSNAKELRYVYLKNESYGYKVFGYVPFEDLSVIDVRSGRGVNFDPPPTSDAPERSRLLPESLTALINILSLRGKVETLISDSEYESLCKMRAGEIVYEEENEIREAAKDSLILVDTNVYINIGPRLERLTRSERGVRLIPLRSVYNELLAKVNGGSKDRNLYKFIMGLESYRDIHKVPPDKVPSYGDGKMQQKGPPYGDREIVEELKRVKQSVEDKVVFVTADVENGNKAHGNAIQTIILRNKVKSKRDVGELLHCLGSTRNLDSPNKDRVAEITLDGEIVAEVMYTPPDLNGEKLTEVRTLRKDLNYASMLEKLQSF
ncbi:PIN domain-containing protein [Metallosphaera cuprina]|uniref:PIN domain-containing protein n=1 Tax=Metallosphaera cuprina (strain Ar-4) TaxID=1006006 RepID=F4G365_METCR|nr:PIN domain-containing protein [Metallosphaera cuprina]AEB95263.1 conserved hypothetical protein [Metallosphaera cuprina Ar-4]